MQFKIGIHFSISISLILRYCLTLKLLGANILYIEKVIHSPSTHFNFVFRF